MRAFVLWLGMATVAAATQQSAVWVDLPFIRQEKRACGAASVAMVMQYWIREGFLGIPAEQAEPDRVHAAIYSSQAQGTPASDLERYLREHGFQTFTFRGEWEDLRQHLSKGRPLIVCLKPGGRDPLHYVVVAGVEGEYVLVNDPARRKLTKFRRQSFEAEWKGTNFWTLLAVPSEER